MTAQWQADCNDGISSVGGSKSFDYTGSVQSFNACAGRTYKLEVWGAQGGVGNTNDSSGGNGGYTYGDIKINTNTNLYIVVGGAGRITSSVNSIVAGGYNGGGSTRVTYSAHHASGSGGGATHISAYNCGELKNCASYTSNIIIVAGGGGGTSSNNVSETEGFGGSGGGSIAGSGSICSGCGNVTSDAPIQATQTGGYQFGLGASTTIYSQTCAGAGGGGWYGGNIAKSDRCNSHGGGGGSGYINKSILKAGTYGMYCRNGLSNTKYGDPNCGGGENTTIGSNHSSTATANYAKQGNGYARITYLGT